MRVAAVTTIAVAIVILVLCVAVDLVVAHTLRSSAATRLTSELQSLTRDRGRHVLIEPDLDDPFLVWQLDASGHVISSSVGAPSLTAAARRATSPTEMSIAGNDLIVAGTAFDGGRLIGAVSLAGESSSVTTLLVTEAIIGPILLAAVFGGAVVVGRNAAGPVERARRRQLEFTADASHELRTPLAVIEAETSLALSGARDEDAGTAALRRVAGETSRMRAIVDDLLWLARFDAMPPDPMTEPVDLVTVVELGAQRFASIAERRGIHLEDASVSSAPSLIDAPAEWIDRLVGVLLDNACRYTPPGGHIRISALRERNHVRLTVADDGPGISPERRHRIFDRFHRGTSEGEGAGLGLAIGNAVVGSTRGHWQIEDNPGGGISIGVVWPVSRSRLVDSGEGQGSPRALGDGATSVTQ